MGSDEPWRLVQNLRERLSIKIVFEEQKLRRRRTCGQYTLESYLAFRNQEGILHESQGRMVGKEAVRLLDNWDPVSSNTKTQRAKRTSIQE